MSKIHSKINSIKTVALVVIGIGIVVVITQTIFIISNIISSQANSEKTINPQVIQQQNIQKAYDLIQSQTVDSN